MNATRSWLANNSYPTGVIGGSAVTNYMFGIIPGATQRYGMGGPATVIATGKASDAITVIYADYAFPLNSHTSLVSGD